MSDPSWKKIIDEIAELARNAGRPITLVAVTKGQSADRVNEALSTSQGRLVLGESYLDEALEKRTKITPKNLEKAEWHFLGRLQSRKIGDIVKNFSCIHTVARLKELEVLSHAPAPNFFLQVNTSNEDQKNGFFPNEVAAALDHCRRLKLDSKILGLMTLPSPIDEVGEKKVRDDFQTLRRLRDSLIPQGSLNMGTSGDYKIAIEEGADWIRLGTVLFGQRS